jgi:hypothetical protein
METKSDTVEIDLPETSLIRQLIEGVRLEDGKENECGDSELKTVQTTLTDEEYQKMLSDFLTQLRDVEKMKSPEEKLKRKLGAFKEVRKRKSTNP